MTTSDRVLGVLALFSLEEAEWTVEDAAKRLDLTVSTAYRYFRSLAGAGLIVALATGRYVLGPAIIQYDRQIRLQDPLTVAAQPVMRRLTRKLPAHALTLLCRLFRSQVICVHQEAVRQLKYAVSYERGRPMPLFRGAASKIILANMELRAVRALYREEPSRFSQAGLGKDWHEVKWWLRNLRSANASVTEGEVDSGMCGISVPVFESAGVIVGSLSVVAPVRHIRASSVSKMIMLLRTAAEEIARRLPPADPDKRPARKGAPRIAGANHRNVGRASKRARAPVRNLSIGK